MHVNIIKVEHPKMEEPRWDATTGWIPSHDMLDEMIRACMFEMDDVEYDEFESEAYYVELEPDEIEEVIENYGQ